MLDGLNQVQCDEPNRRLRRGTRCRRFGLCLYSRGIDYSCAPMALRVY